MFRPGAVWVNTDCSKSDYSIYGTTETKGGFPFSIRAEYGVTDFLESDCGMVCTKTRSQSQT
jgi:hypothetical protein